MSRASTKSIYLLLSLAYIILGTNPVYCQTAQQIAKEAFKYTVILVMENAKGQPTTIGSGFLIRNGEIASNLHVIEGASSGYAKIVGQKAKYDIEGITAIDPKRDLIILKIPYNSARKSTLGDSDSVQVGETVYAIGNPQGLEGTFSQGIVSSVRNIGNDKLLQITAPISPGSSGGPVLNSKGNVIGVSIATFKGGQNLNFAIPSNYLKLLLKKTKPVKPLKNYIKTKQQKSLFSGLGDRNSKGLECDQLIWRYPYGIGGNYTFSLRNRLREGVKNIVCLVIFHDTQNNPIDIDLIHYKGLIPAGLAKRVQGAVDKSVQELTTDTRSGAKGPKTKVEYRILDFQIVN